jgi:ribonuclease HI
MEASLKIYTDGGCSGNPGLGGWAYVIVQETFQGQRILSSDLGGEEKTTNNRMELKAVIAALNALSKAGNAPKQIAVFTDSQYVQKGISEWIHNWKRNSWRTSDKSPVKNQELWKELDSLAGEFTIEWEWVRGHAGNEYNELCDQMTRQAIAEIL